MAGKKAKPKGGLTAEQVRRANKSDLAAARRTRMRMATTPAAIERRNQQIKRAKAPRPKVSTGPTAWEAGKVPPERRAITVPFKPPTKPRRLRM